ncbi:MAG TPA: hypothetical protein PLV92_00135, partial [Pirellulaceae bacterium]|nr:hypothetical protein [Pirellulaceae bacterium]
MNRLTAEQWREGASPAPQIAIATTTQGGATSEVQRVGFTAMMITGGTFTLTQGGQTTSNLRGSRRRWRSTRRRATSRRRS